MYDHIAIRPLSSLDSKSIDNIFSGKEFSNKIEIVAEGWVLAFLRDIIDIESGGDRVSKDKLGSQLAYFEGNDPGQLGEDKSLANFIGSPKEVITVLGDKIILQSELSVLRILVEWVSPTVSDSNSYEVESVLLKNSSNSWNVVSSITLTSDENLSGFELRELSQETLNENQEVGSNLILILGHLREWGIRESGTYWLIHENQVT